MEKNVFYHLHLKSQVLTLLTYLKLKTQTYEFKTLQEPMLVLSFTPTRKLPTLSVTPNSKITAEVIKSLAQVL